MTQPSSSRPWLDPHQVHPPRALTLMGLGAVAGLAIAGFGLFTARDGSSLVVAADAVAVVNQQPISRIDYLAQLQALGFDATATRAEKRQVVEDMIREELFVQRGKELDVGNFDPQVRAAMVAAVDAQAAASALTSAPTEAELRDWYARNRARYASEGSMTVQEFLFPSLEAAMAGEAALRAGGVPSGGRLLKRTTGEEFYFAAKIHLGDAVFAAAAPLADGEISAPVQAEDGVHRVRMVRNLRPRPYGFEEARDQVVSDRQAALVTRFQKGEAAFLRKRAKVVIAPDVR